jgi:Saf4/Yju2 protein
MAERKVLSHYYPPDFDPTKVERKRVDIYARIKIRMALPVNVTCGSCRRYMSKGSKFNAHKQLVRGEDYLGLKIFALYFKCKQCSGELCLKTDPENRTYQCHGGTVLDYETAALRRHVSAVEEEREAAKMRANGDANALDALEYRTAMNKSHAEQSADIESVRELNSQARSAEMLVGGDVLTRLHCATATHERSANIKVDEEEAVARVDADEFERQREALRLRDLKRASAARQGDADGAHDVIAAAVNSDDDDDDDDLAVVLVVKKKRERGDDDGAAGENERKRQRPLTSILGGAYAQCSSSSDDDDDVDQ